MSKISNIAVVVLAAGSSSRLGHPKQLVDFRGKNLLQHHIDVLNSKEFGLKLLVLGANKEEIEPKINPHGFAIVENSEWEEGIASSIRAGVKAVQEISNIERILFTVCDQPFINKQILDRLVDASNSGIVASSYGSRLGVPAMFGTFYFQELLALKGDEGAKRIILNEMDKVTQIKFPHGEFDIDTPADLDELNKDKK